MDTVTIFVIFWIFAASFVVTGLIRSGKKALSIFPKLENDLVVYRDKNASGYSLKSWKTKILRTRKSLDIIVLEEEIWLKCIVINARVHEKIDLIHKINKRMIQNVEVKNNQITLSFMTMSDELKQIVLITKKMNDFIDALGIEN